MKGVPLRIELGPRDIEAGKMVLVRRDTHEKVEAPLENAAETVQKLLADIQSNLLEMAKKRKEERVVSAENMDELLKGVEGASARIRSRNRRPPPRACSSRTNTPKRASAAAKRRSTSYCLRAHIDSGTRNCIKNGKRAKKFRPLYCIDAKQGV